MPIATTVHAQPDSAIAVTRPSLGVRARAMRAKTARVASEHTSITPVPPIVTTRGYGASDPWGEEAQEGSVVIRVRVRCPAPDANSPAAGARDPYSEPMGLLLKLLAHAAGLAGAAWLLPDMFFNGPVTGTAEVEAKVLPLLGVALILTVVNTIVRPVLKLVAMPLILVTIGIFLLVINVAMLLLTAAIAEEIGLDFHIEGLLTALIASMIVTVCAWSADLLLGNE